MRVSMKIPKTHSKSELILHTKLENAHHLTREQAYEIARCLIAMADILEAFEKRDPVTGQFRKILE